MRFLKTNTAVIVTVGPFYDKTDGVTIENALTATNERITLTVDLDNGSAPTLVLDNVTGAASGTSNDIVVITNCDAGLYQIELAAANVNYLGRAMLTITDAANHVPVFHEFMIVSAAFYDFMCGTTIPDVNVTKVGGTSQTAGDLAALVTTVDTVVDTIAAGVVTIDGIVDSILVDTGTDIPASIALLDPTAGVPVAYAPDTAVRTFGDNDGGSVSNLAAHDESFMDTGENTSNGISVVVTRNTSELDEVPTVCRVTGYYNGSAAHNINVYLYNYTESAYDLVGTMANRNTAFDYTFPMSTDNHNGSGEMKIQFVHNTTTYNGGHVLRLDWISFEKILESQTFAMASDIAAIKNNTDKLTFIPATNDLIVTLDGEIELSSLDAKVDLVLADTDELQTDLTDGGRLDLLVDAILLDTGTTLDGKMNVLDGKADNILTDTGTTLDAAITAIQGDVTDILADTAELQTDWTNGGRLDLILDSAVAANPTAEDIADAVWDEAMAGHVAAGSSGEALAAAQSAGDPWSTPIPGAYGAGTAGKKIADMTAEVTAILVDTGTTLDGKINVIEGIVDSILVDTGTDIPAAIAVVDGIVDDILVDTGTDIPADIAGLSIPGAAPSAAAVADAVWDEVISTGHAVGNSAAVKLMAAAAGLATSQAGLGAVTCNITVTIDSVPLQDCDVWITSDEAGATVVAGTLQTNASGIATFFLDAGTYYVWQQKTGYNFTNPDELVVT